MDGNLSISSLTDSHVVPSSHQNNNAVSGISRRTFLSTTAIATAGLAVSFANWQPASAEATENQSLPIFGEGNPLSQEQFDTLMYDIKVRFENGEVEIDPYVYYSTEIVTPFLMESIQKRTGYNYLNFLAINYRNLNDRLRKANLPQRVIPRRLIIIDESTSVPTGMGVDWTEKGPVDSHGGGGLILRNYINWEPFWDPSVEGSQLVNHEQGHILFALPDSYWHDCPDIINSPALDGVKGNWRRYLVYERESDSRSGLMNMGVANLDLESQLVIARREFEELSALPLHKHYYRDISGFPNRFPSKSVMKIRNDKLDGIRGAKVKVYKKKPVGKMNLERRSTGEFAYQPEDFELVEISGLDDLSIGEDGTFILPNLFEEDAYDDGLHIRTPSDTLFFRFENNNGLVAFMWMDSIDFSMATGVEPTYPDEIEYTINPVDVHDMETSPRDHDWRISFHPLNGFVPDKHVDPVLAQLVAQYSTTSPSKTPQLSRRDIFLPFLGK